MSSYSNQSKHANQEKKLKKELIVLKSVPTNVFIKRIKELLSEKYSLYEIFEMEER